MIVTTDTYADFKASITAIGGALGGTVLYFDLTGAGGSFYVVSFYNSNGHVHAAEAELSSQPGSLGTDFALVVALSGKPRLRP